MDVQWLFHLLGECSHFCALLHELFLQPHHFLLKSHMFAARLVGKGKLTPKVRQLPPQDSHVVCHLSELHFPLLQDTLLNLKLLLL